MTEVEKQFKKWWKDRVKLEPTPEKLLPRELAAQAWAWAWKLATENREAP